MSKDIRNIVDEVIREVTDPNWMISSIPDGYQHGVLDEDEDESKETKTEKNGKTKTTLGEN